MIFTHSCIELITNFENYLNPVFFCFSIILIVFYYLKVVIKQWMREKNRFYMTNSLIKKLNEDKPKRAEIFDLLGKPGLEGRIKDTEVSYWLKSDGFLSMWELYIYFDDNGNFKSVVIAYAD